MGNDEPMDTGKNSATLALRDPGADCTCPVHREIELRTGRRVRGLSVTRLNGCLCVRGRVSSYYLKQLAIAAVMSFVNGTNIDVELDLQVIR